MTQTNSFDNGEIKKFLFRELNETEREAFEEKYFTGDELFYEVVDVENELIDRYAAGSLPPLDLNRFEKSLEYFPDRVEKVLNAKALHSFIKSEKQTANVEVESSFWSKIADFFTFKLSVFQYAAAGLIFVLAIGTTFLVIDRVRLNRELARIKEQSGTDAVEEKTRILNEQLKAIQEREKRIQTDLENSNGQADILNSQLERERNERLRLENEIKNLQKEKGVAPPATPDIEPRQPPKPVIASIVLSPFVRTKSGVVKTVEIPAGAEQISVTLQIPKDSEESSFGVSLNGASVGAGLKPSTTSSGNKFVVVTVPRSRISNDENNTIIVTGKDGVSYRFVFRVRQNSKTMSKSVGSGGADEEWTAVPAK